MNTQTSLVAEQIRLQQWADQIRDCQNRPSDMKVDTWCQEHGITKEFDINSCIYCYFDLEVIYSSIKIISFSQSSIAAVKSLLYCSFP